MINFYKYHNSVLDRYEIEPDIDQLCYWGIQNGYNYNSVLPIILKDAHLASKYAQRIINGRWVEAEPIIMKNSHMAYWYARTVIRGRWKEAEPYIKQNEWYWRYYLKWMKHV